MKVLLLKDVPGIGQRGKILEVKDGYGRNFLIPQMLARIADDAAIREAQTHIAQIQKKQIEKKESLAGLASKLKIETLSFSRKANAKGVLFDAVDAKDISFTLEKHGFGEIKKDHIKGAPLKALGEHTVTVTMGEYSIPVKIQINLHE
ncbi:MAG: 50S ribosomal protein L9 [Patescibacteria group bacterium]